jgi:hypothetical protein
MLQTPVKPITALPRLFSSALSPFEHYLIRVVYVGRHCCRGGLVDEDGIPINPLEP